MEDDNIKNKLVIISLILIALFAISSVSAEENITDINEGADLLATDSSTGNFNDLNNTISESSDELSLNQDYVYDSDRDTKFTSGVVISKNNFTLDSKGHYIDGNNKASIFSITGSNVTIKNLIFKNAYNGTIEFTMVNNITFDNITIVNCS
ncbi:MAG: hypothetical protein IJ258_07115 [Methanobrevibacter sp.]|uniref:hypothetical protein n=1 Tax=Methanobrevibacter sp. TaxID=66852 RepID=UPI0025EE368A|nr:hypothetical protein [Methanobrevibacter sp.]MBQ8017862.1 hypothetical protein [Methanobrevibacter sp.]